MIIDYKGHPVSNNLSVFRFYKGIYSKRLETVISELKGVEKKNPEDIDLAEQLEPFINIYHAMRCAGENCILPRDEIEQELDLHDIGDESFINMFKSLLDTAGTNKRTVVKYQKKTR
jgi:hypothetical protein